MPYIFFVEYTKDRRTEKSFKTAASAKRAYVSYTLNPEVDATGWGWEEVNENLLSHQVAKLRLHKVAK